MTGDGTGAARFGRRARALVAVTAVLAGLLASEALVRLSGRAPAFKPLRIDEAASVYERSENPILGYELKAGYRDPGADLARSYPSTNSHGQRDVERAVPKPPGVRRILLLGDSVVEGHEIRELDDTMSRQLERLLGDGTEVLNFGVSGYCTLAEVELLRTKGLAFDPDVVVLVFVLNDFDNFNREAYRLAGASPRPAWVRAAFARSHLFRMLAVELDLFGFGAELDPVGWNKEAIGDDNVPRGLALLRRLADEHGFDARVVVWPVFRDDGIHDGVTVRPGSDALVIEALAASEGLPVHRLRPFFERALEEAPDNPRLAFTVGDELHPSAEGCRVTALALHEILESAPPAVAEPDPETLRLARQRLGVLGADVPDYSHVHNNLGVDLRAQGRLEEAVAEFREALVEAPEFVEARNNLANALRALGRPAEALEHYEAALAARPDVEEVRFNYALALAAVGRHEEALPHFARAVERRPDFGEALLGWGVSLRALGRHDEALSRLGEAAGWMPASAGVRIELGNTLAAAGRVNAALPEFVNAARLDPQSADAWNGIGNALVLTGDPRGAVVPFREAARLRPDWGAPLDALARVMIRAADPGLGSPNEAVGLAERAVELTGRRQPAFLDTLAQGYAAVGRFDEAATVAAEALALAREAGRLRLAAALEKRLEAYRKRAAAPPT